MSDQPDHTPNLQNPLEAASKTLKQAFDPFGMVSSQINAQLAWLAHPREFMRAADAFTSDLIKLTSQTLFRPLGLSEDEIHIDNPADARFADPAWSQSVRWDLLKDWYLSITHRLQDLILETPGLSEHDRHTAAFWQRNWLNMVAPTNFFWLNPQAMDRCAQTRGASITRGLQNFVRDAQAQNIQMVDASAFKVGQNLGTTAGKVIFRNELVELIHYTPTTAQVRQTPLLIITPWINKFYILDLTEKKSLVKHLTDQGFSVFIVSWRNPPAEMRNTTFDDYLLQGVNELVRVTTAFCKVPQVHLVGYCIGGTLVSSYMAWANKHYPANKLPVAQWTLLATLTDFSHPGEINIFIDDKALDELEDLMARKGYLDGSEMAASFRLLRSNSLIWNYWVHSYLLGEELVPFDVLFWNVDATRMPQAMHSYYLRQMYLHNNLIQPEALTIGGEPISLGRITQELYAVTAEEDHIAPWTSCYQIRKTIAPKTKVRFVRSTSGHILGIVNPPVNPPKRSYWVGEPSAKDSAQDWLEHAEKHPGTWWTDWISWLNERTGPMVKAYPASNRQFPALADAPGTYVMEK